MKIIIPPYPNLPITEQAFERDIVQNSESKITLNNDTNDLMLVVEFESGEKKLLKARPVLHKDIQYISAFPNPIHLFFDLAIEHYLHSEKIKEENFPRCGKKYGENLYLLDIESNNTHHCYNQFIKYRASSIIMLVTAIEAFLNHVIPNDFVYKTNRNGKDIEYNKEQIESTKISFNEKLTKVIPQWINNSVFWDTYETDKSNILELYRNRKNIIHLKTNSKDDFDRYFEEIDIMLDFNIKSSIESTIKFMNLVVEKFIELEKIS